LQPLQNREAIPGGQIEVENDERGCSFCRRQSRNSLPMPAPCRSGLARRRIFNARLMSGSSSTIRIFGFFHFEASVGLV
jgi:hypothetical protein